MIINGVNEITKRSNNYKRVMDSNGGFNNRELFLMKRRRRFNGEVQGTGKVYSWRNY